MAGKQISTSKVDKQKLVMAVTESVFAENNMFIYNNVWRLNQKTSGDEINFYLKKLQFVTSVISESSRDIIVCSTICVVAIILQYILTTTVLSPNPIEAITLQLADSSVSRVVSRNGLVMEAAKKTIWEPMHYALLGVIKIYQLRLFEVNEFEEDL